MASPDISGRSAPDQGHYHRGPNPLDVIPAKDGIHPEMTGLSWTWKHLQMDPGLRRDDTVSGKVEW
jgi:hypothetical protein